MIALTTNRRNFIALAEGVRAAGQFDESLQGELIEAVEKRASNGFLPDDFDYDRFLSHALSGSPINPRRVFRRMADLSAEGYEMVLVKIDGTDRVFGAYVRPGEVWNGWAVPYVSRFVARQIADWQNAEAYGEEGQTLEFDEDDNLLVVEPNSANDFGADEPDGIMTISQGAHGLYKLDMGWTWTVVAEIANFQPADSYLAYGPGGEGDGSENGPEGDE